MHVNLTNNKAAKIRCYIDDAEPTMTYGKEASREFRSYHVDVDVLDENGENLDSFKGTSYCHPNDRFVKKSGRKLAMRKMFNQNIYINPTNGQSYRVLLEKEDCSIIAEAILGKK